MDERHANYLILGAGAAGVRAAEAIRAADREASVLMLSLEAGLPCRRPLLSKAALLPMKHGDASLRTAAWYESLGVRLVGDCAVAALDVKAGRVDTDLGPFSYDRCVYALGAEPFLPPIPGRELPGVFAVRNERDVLLLKRAALDADGAVVIGGGVIGLELALSLLRAGLRVAVLETLPRLMPRVLDEDTSRRVEALFPDVTVQTGVRVRAIEGHSSVERVVLEDGTVFPCEIAVLCCGQRPNAGIARRAGIECGRGVTVNEKMETSARGVWACGDCAELRGVNAALWTQALTQGGIAGANAAGESRVLRAVDASLILHGQTGSLFAMGDPGLDASKQYVCEIRRTEHVGFSINDRPAHAMEKRYYLDGTLVGGCIVGALHSMERMRREILGEEEGP